MDEKKKAPKLRFKGFTDDWEQRKWKEIMLVNSGRDYKHLNEGKIPVYGTGGYMLSVDKSLSNIDAIGIGRKGTIDKPQYLNAPFWTVDTLFFMTPLKETNLKFLYALSQNINWKKYDESTGLPSLSKTTINNIVVKLPHNNEQNKIGKLISQIDNLLILQQRKLEQLKSIKNGILQEIFPDKDLPNLHLKEYEIHWRQRKLEEITSTITKGTTPLDKSGKGTINFIKVENINPDNNEININSKISKEEHLGRLKRSILQENDILFSIAGTLGRIGIISPDLLPANTNQALAIIRLKEGDLKFVSTVLKGRTVKKYIRQNPTTGAQPNLSLKQVSNLKIPFPSLQEQTQLGKFFEKTDLLTDKQQRIVTQFEQAKLFLLQNMFI
ncbi:restriction endonuclease subunit S [uncultured Lactobacillus sp.]|uniref:restriction endonuclease subunit S n=1 Tax=uncultured Lactobacillus sp. TaxID=153152 RepID=UPI00259B0B0C|nr:restriction endonuclease subunit S [uncultured Lactobacillus sp.]